MWHFSEVNKQLRYDDNREIKVGETLTATEKPIELCNYGMHASARIIDAVQYAPGPYVWFVELGADAIHGGDKSVSSSRTPLWGYDATEVLRKFSRLVALNALKTYYDEAKYGKLDPIITQWLETGDESLRSAAGSAARSAAWSAAWSAAGSAAWSAAGSAAWSAARSAAGSAAWSAAGSAAWSAAGSAAWSAAGSAAGSAAWSAAGSAQNELLERMIIAGKDEYPGA